jgi:hypothetical protein
MHRRHMLYPECCTGAASLKEVSSPSPTNGTSLTEEALNP